MRKTYAWTLNTPVRLTQAQRDNEYIEQQIWCCGNGNSFNFISLPAELREQVYLHAVGPVIVANCPRKDLESRRPSFNSERDALGCCRQYGDRGRGARRDPNIEPPNLSIMQTANKCCYNLGLSPRFPTYILDILRSNRQLKFLDLRFTSPKHPSAECPHCMELTTNVISHSCQKVWIDCLSVLGWDK
ncbi:hypothetical protein T440DRAFT_546915 [Plenodomus tracheiphilus IPT5]|uniref:Uncharacterized protein n=1 Tax=Plenodomus tracheiphilus IPT5 TaxID=1408161 RepID=A0A6A7AP28_9PLEO|nr:hypothetical protein T440DRAFT_546915 [Plenodomus tracheiphilus IPT5]